MTPSLRLPVLIAALLTGAPAVAEPATQTPQEAATVVENWGLIGKWSQDCRRAPASSAPLLTYTKASDGSAIRTATAGRGEPNTSRIIAARAMPSGDIEIAEKDSKDVMTFVLSKDGSGKNRSMSSRDDKGFVYIRDGKFVDSGKATPLLARCD